MTAWIDACWRVLLDLAPWLLLGAAIAGILHVALPAGFVRRQLGGRFRVLKAVALGVPLPLCSCGVIPAGLGLKRDGASDGATVGFLISTPQTGVDSILVSASFLGWPFAVFKVAAAAATGLAGGWITDRLSPVARQEAATEAPTTSESPRDWRGGLRYGLEILRMIWRWIVLGIVVSAALDVLVPDGFLAGLSSAGRVVPLVAALAVSLPLYVCATASVPIAAALVAAGLPPGAALVFLMAGPATNVATIGAIFRTLGRRALATYLATIVGGSLVLGATFDFLLTGVPALAPHDHGGGSWWAAASAWVLLLLLSGFAVADARRLLSRWRTARVNDTLEVPVQGMTCNGCVNRLEKALRGEDGVREVSVILSPGRAIVRGAIDERRLREAVERAGFGTA